MSVTYSTGIAGSVARRAGSFVASLFLTFIGLTAVTFFISRLTRIDPVLAIVGDKASQEVYDKTYIALGLDQPLIVQYWHYLKRLRQRRLRRLGAHLAARAHRPAAGCFRRRSSLPPSPSSSACCVGVPAGVLAGARKGRWPDHLVRVVGLFGYSMPVFWLGLVGLFVFYGKLGWVSGTGPARRLLRGHRHAASPASS